MSDAKWISSLAAVLRLRELGLSQPEGTLAQWAEAKYLRSRAANGRFGHDLDGLTFPAEPNVSISPWPDVPADFWYWVNKNGAEAEAHFEAGIFAARVFADLDLGDRSYEEHIKLYGVTFHEADLNGLLAGQATARPSPKLEETRGRKKDICRWSEFGAALAFIAHTCDQQVLKSQDSIYNAVADALTAGDRKPLDERQVRDMLKLFLHWNEQETVSLSSEK